MTTTVEAVYEQGILRLAHLIPLAEGTRVEVTVVSAEPATQSSSSADILSAIAALPMEVQDVELSSRNHDCILYGEAGTKCFL